MPRHDRAYGVWYSSRAKGGNKRRGSVKLFKRSKTGQAPASRYSTKIGRRTEA